MCQLEGESVKAPYSLPHFHNRVLHPHRPGAQVTSFSAQRHPLSSSTQPLDQHHGLHTKTRSMFKSIAEGFPSVALTAVYRATPCSSTNHTQKQAAAHFAASTQGTEFWANSWTEGKKIKWNKKSIPKPSANSGSNGAARQMPAANPRATRAAARTQADRAARFRLLGQRTRPSRWAPAQAASGSPGRPRPGPHGFPAGGPSAARAPSAPPPAAPLTSVAAGGGVAGGEQQDGAQRQRLGGPHAEVVVDLPLAQGVGQARHLGSSMTTVRGGAGGRSGAALGPRRLPKQPPPPAATVPTGAAESSPAPRCRGGAASFLLLLALLFPGLPAAVALGSSWNTGMWSTETSGCCFPTLPSVCEPKKSSSGRSAAVHIWQCVKNGKESVIKTEIKLSKQSQETYTLQILFSGFTWRTSGTVQMYRIGVISVLWASFLQSFRISDTLLYLF